MRHRLLKYILDIESVIQEIEIVKSKASNDFTVFKSDIILQRAIERDLEIIGEAVRHMSGKKVDARLWNQTIK